MKTLHTFLLAGALTVTGVNCLAQKADTKGPAVAAANGGASVAASGAMPQGDAKRGRAAFEPCAVCHSPEAWRSAGLSTRKGPSLKGLYKKSKLINGNAVNDSTVLAVIEKGGKGMAPYKDALSIAQKADILAYLKGQ